MSVNSEEDYDNPYEGVIDYDYLMFMQEMIEQQKCRDLNTAFRVLNEDEPEEYV